MNENFRRMPFGNPAVPAHMRIGFLGAGEIAQVLVDGILANNLVDPDRIMAFSPMSGRHLLLRDKYGIAAASSNAEVIENSDYIFSCMRSEQVAGALRQVRRCDFKDRALISASSGTPIQVFESLLGDVAVVRSLPTYPSVVGEGAIAVSFNRLCSEEQKSGVMALFNPMGRCFILREDQIDAFTAVTCLPHFLQIFQAGVEGAVMMGLDLDTSRKIVMQTARGALRMWEEKPDQLGEMLDRSATPGGITARMLHYLDMHRFKDAIKGCVEEGTVRTRAFGELIRRQLDRVDRA